MFRPRRCRGRGPDRQAPAEPAEAAEGPPWRPRPALKFRVTHSPGRNLKFGHHSRALAAPGPLQRRRPGLQVRVPLQVLMARPVTRTSQLFASLMLMNDRCLSSGRLVTFNSPCQKGLPYDSRSTTRGSRRNYPACSQLSCIAVDSPNALSRQMRHSMRHTKAPSRSRAFLRRSCSGHSPPPRRSIGETRYTSLRL